MFLASIFIFIWNYVLSSWKTDIQIIFRVNFIGWFNHWKSLMRPDPSILSIVCFLTRVHSRAIVVTRDNISTPQKKHSHARTAGGTINSGTQTCRVGSFKNRLWSPLIIIRIRNHTHISLTEIFFLPTQRFLKNTWPRYLARLKV